MKIAVSVSDYGVSSFIILYLVVFRGGRRRPDTVLVWGMRRGGLRPPRLLSRLLLFRRPRPLVTSAGAVDGLVGGRAGARLATGLVDVRVAAGGADQVHRMLVVDVAGGRRGLIPRL